MSLSTAALTTALSKDSETSRIDRTKMIHSIEAVAARLPDCAHPYHTPSARQTSVNTIENL